MTMTTDPPGSSSTAFFSTASSVAKVTEDPNLMPLSVCSTTSSSGTCVRATRTGYSCRFSFVSMPATPGSHNTSSVTTHCQ